MAHLRHLSVKIWISIFFWILVAVWVLPLIQKILGVRWLVIPAIFIFICVYVVAGRLMEHFALAKFSHLLKEAGVMERAGMTKESSQALTAAVDLFDSFLFSAKARRPIAEKLLIRAAQHRLVRESNNIAEDQIVLAYLEHFPSDKEAARIWLQAVLKLEILPPRCVELITQLSQKQPQNKSLQHLLGRFFLSESRSDFEALQVYRRVMAMEGFSDKKFVVKLANLLLNEGQTDEWALEIYLSAYNIAPKAKRFLSGILACVKNISPHERNRSLLKRARELLTRTRNIIPSGSPTQDQTLPYTNVLIPPKSNPAMDPDESDETLIPTEFSATILLHKNEQNDQKNPLPKPRTDIADAFRATITRVEGFVNQLSQIKINSSATSMVRGTVVVIILMGGIFMTLHLVNSIFKKSDNPETSSSISVAVHNDPFTLQVGAYLSQQDAKRQVRKLRKKSLNAYLTEAQSRDRKWYQVRISHFADRLQAKAYGESLKSKGVINDYYVANYRSPLNATESTNIE